MEIAILSDSIRDLESYRLRSRCRSSGLRRFQRHKCLWANMQLENNCGDFRFTPPDVGCGVDKVLQDRASPCRQNSWLGNRAFSQRALLRQRVVAGMKENDGSLLLDGANINPREVVCLRIVAGNRLDRGLHRGLQGLEDRRTAPAN